MASSSAVSSDTDNRGKSHIVMYTKSTLAAQALLSGSGADGRLEGQVSHRGVHEVHTLAEQTMLAALELTDVSKGVSAVSTG